MSIRARITLVATVIVGVILVAASIVLVVVQQRQLLDDLDRTLERRSAALDVGLVEATGSATDEDRVEQVIGSDGTVVAASANLEGLGPIADPADRSTRSIDIPAIDDDRFRVFFRQIDAADGSYVLIVGESADELNESVRVLTVSLAIVIPAAIIALALLVWFVVGRTLQPVEAIRAEVAELSAAELHRRVPEPDSGDEIARLAETMNHMLDRLEHSTAQQRQFVADASHELRTPLTRLRTALEVDGDERGLLEDVIGMQHLVDDLLHLARSDAGSIVVAQTRLDLDDVVRREAELVRAETADVVIDLSAVSGAAVRGSVDQLARLVRNLLANAVRHAAGTVRVGVTEAGGVVRLHVDDDGLGVPVDQRAAVFERFARGDEARSRRDGGTGLGLAIVRDIAERHGGSVVVSDAPGGGGARFEVTLPAA